MTAKKMAETARAEVSKRWGRYAWPQLSADVQNALVVEQIARTMRMQSNRSLPIGEYVDAMDYVYVHNSTEWAR